MDGGERIEEEGGEWRDERLGRREEREGERGVIREDVDSRWKRKVE